MFSSSHSFRFLIMSNIWSPAPSALRVSRPGVLVSVLSGISSPPTNVARERKNIHPWEGRQRRFYDTCFERSGAKTDYLRRSRQRATQRGMVTTSFSSIWYNGRLNNGSWRLAKNGLFCTFKGPKCKERKPGQGSPFGHNYVLIYRRFVWVIKICIVKKVIFLEEKKS